MSHERLIRRLYRKMDVLSHRATCEFINTTAVLTGFHQNSVEEIHNGKMNVNLIDPTRSLIYNTLVKFYNRHRSDGGKLPTTYDLFDALNNKFPHLNIEEFRNLLVKMDFIWKKIAGPKAYRIVVIENPLIRFQRFNYLEQVKGIRDRQQHIYYIDEVAYNQQMFMDLETSRDFENTIDGWQQRVIYAVGKKNVICSKNIQEFSATELEEWIVGDLLAVLNEPSVIVVQNLEHHKSKLIEIPTIFSSGNEIMSWLDYHDIPYDPNMPRLTLYQLAEEYTDLETPLYKLNLILSARGHMLLRLPKWNEKLSPAAILFRLIEHNWTDQEGNIAKAINAPKSTPELLQTYFADVLKSSEKFLEGYTGTIVAQEERMMLMEKDHDSVMDTLVKNTSSRNLFNICDDTDLAGCSGSDSDFE